jgi:acetolactate synthase-1/2/3 large subunit
MKLTDFVAKYIKEECKVNTVFGVTGGGAVHIFDSISKVDIKPVFMHHEQAASLAAGGYARINNNIGVCIVTTGPGGTNALTGVLSAWTDSIPLLVISGQSRYSFTSQGKGIRQLGSQEFDITSLVSKITKYAVTVDNPKKIKYYLDKALYLATNGRKSPVWVDIPLDFQMMDINVDSLEQYVKPSLKMYTIPSDALSKLYSEAKRPLILAGAGIRLSGAADSFRNFIEDNKIPFVYSWNSHDLVYDYHPLNIGLIGIAGNRGANLAIQNCDLLISIGSHLGVNITSTNIEGFAPKAKKVVVDIDQVELNYNYLKVDLKVLSDANYFLNCISLPSKDNSVWRSQCNTYKGYNKVSSNTIDYTWVNPYNFIEELSKYKSSYAVDGGGTALYISNQAINLRQGSRLIVSASQAPMGTGLPESIGACFASNGYRIVCMVGDGSFQFNIQELQTIVEHCLPIKIVVFNNEGYLAIRHTQESFLDKRYIGSSVEGRLSLPDYRKVGKAYGIRVIRVNNDAESIDAIREMMSDNNPCICEIMVSPEQKVTPSMGFIDNGNGTFSHRPLEDMCPYLDREELKRLMVGE